MQDFTNERSSSRIRRPNELVVTVNLPGVESAKNVELDIFEKRLLLQCSKPLYKLDVSTLINFHDSTTVVSQASAHGCFFITHNICTRGRLPGIETHTFMFVTSQFLACFNFDTTIMSTFDYKS